MEDALIQFVNILFDQIIQEKYIIFSTKSFSNEIKTLMSIPFIGLSMNNDIDRIPFTFKTYNTLTTLYTKIKPNYYCYIIYSPIQNQWGILFFNTFEIFYLFTFHLSKKLIEFPTIQCSQEIKINNENHLAYLLTLLTKLNQLPLKESIHLLNNEFNI